MSFADITETNARNVSERRCRIGMVWMKGTLRRTTAIDSEVPTHPYEMVFKPVRKPLNWSYVTAKD